MSIETMKRRIVAFADKDVGNAASLEDLPNYELTFGVKIPESYRAFLMNVGWARFAHEQLFGLGGSIPKYLDLADRTYDERYEARTYMPYDLVPIMNDGAGNHYCLQTAKLANGECPVVFWDHELGEDQVPEFVSRSFDEWLIELLDALELQ